MLAENAGLDPLALKNLRQYVAEEREATGGVVPTDKDIIVERFRDELGDWRVAILTPFGARVHAPWSLGIESKLHDRLGMEVQAIWSDDGIVIRLPDADELPPLEAVLLDPDEVDDLIVNQVGQSAVFAARFRENAARALLLPRRRPGSRTPLWQMRQRASDLLGVASRYGEFPILLETYRECLRDVFDLPALTEVMTNVRSRQIRVQQVDSQYPSPFASSLVFSYVASFMYEGDQPLAERRAQALTLDRRMLSELVGDDELRDLIDVNALMQTELELQALDENRQATSVDGAHDLLRRLGDLTVAELNARSQGEFADQLVKERRALMVRISGEDRLIAAEDAGRYRDGLGTAMPTGIADAFLEPVPDATLQLVRRYARTHGPFLADEPALRFSLPTSVVENLLRQIESDGRVVLGEFRPGGVDREWCDIEVLRILRQRSLAVLRKEIEPTDVEALVRYLPSWQGVGSDSMGLERVYEVISRLQGVPVPISVLERDVLGTRVKNYSPRLLDELLAAGEVMWVGAGPSGKNDGKVRLFLRENAPSFLKRWPTTGIDRPEEPEHQRIRDILRQRGACFFADLKGKTERETLDALWDLVWAGEVTNDSFHPLRAIEGTTKAAKSSKPRRPRVGQITTIGPPTAQGRWSLVYIDENAEPTRTTTAVVNVLMERHGVLTREAVKGEGVPGGFASIYPVLKAMEESGRIRRGYFVSGRGGAQFALPGAVDRLRAFREGMPSGLPRALVLAATDPANPFGVSLPWPEKGPQRVPGAFVVLVDGQLALYVEKGAKGLQAYRPFDGTWESDAIASLLSLLGGRMNRLMFQNVPEELSPMLRDSGFTPTPRGMVRYA
jgi:ATP-dependent helicase Lhr and Lhr-like helicase